MPQLVRPRSTSQTQSCLPQSLKHSANPADTKPHCDLPEGTAPDAPRGKSPPSPSSPPQASPLRPRPGLLLLFTTPTQPHNTIFCPQPSMRATESELVYRMIFQAQQINANTRKIKRRVTQTFKYIHRPEEPAEERKIS